MHDLKTYPQCQQHQPHLLIAEDDVPLAHFLKRGLQADKYSVDLTHDGEAAIQGGSSLTTTTCSFWT
jgi:ActR/RegA family two-component response regulator